MNRDGCKNLADLRAIEHRQVDTRNWAVKWRDAEAALRAVTTPEQRQGSMWAGLRQRYGADQAR